MCVASGECSTSMGSNPRDSTPSKISLAGPEQDRGDIERELVDNPGDKRLPHGGGAARDVDALLAGRLTRLCRASKPSVTKWKVVPPSISIGS